MVDAGPDGGLDTVFIAFTFALRDQQWELPRSILRLNLFSTVRGTRQELQTEVRSPWISHWTLWLSLIRCLDHIPGSLVCSWPFKSSSAWGAGVPCPHMLCPGELSHVGTFQHHWANGLWRVCLEAHKVPACSTAPREWAELCRPLLPALQSSWLWARSQGWQQGQLSA